MTLEDLAHIEAQLDLPLTTALARALRSDAPPGELWRDAALFLAHNANLRREFAAFWPPHLLAIGNDDLGHIYFVDTRQAIPAVWIAFSGECADAGALICEVEAENIPLWLGTQN